MGIGIKAEIEHMINMSAVREPIQKAITQSIRMCGVDLLRVAQERTPYEQGTLEKSGHLTVNTSDDGVTATVGFSAYHKGFNYAMWTDQQDYNPSKASLEKGGGKSKFTSAPLPVGTGYLSDTAKKSKAEYEEYIGRRIGLAIGKSGFGK